MFELPSFMNGTLLFMVLALVSVAALSVAVILPAVRSSLQQKRRLTEVVDPDARKRRQPARSAAMKVSSRRKSIEETLRELEEQQKARQTRSRNPSLLIRMRQGGLLWSKTTYVLICIASGLIAYVLLRANGFAPFAAIGFAATAGLALPHLFVNFRRNRRLKAFDRDFPDAVDVITRGLKSGLPLADCLRIIASESRPPLSIEFQSVVDDQLLGVPISEATERMAERVPLTEVNFLAIVIAIQAKTGGSLAEALTNLSRTLRERRKMAAKIRAMSQEAKSSAAIIGALPFLVAGALFVINPDYIMLLFTTFGGQVVLAVSGFWMLIGILVMRKMINFDF